MSNSEGGSFRVVKKEWLVTDEPIRFTPKELDRLLLHCSTIGASDITID